jgi:hypothetical protein
MKRGEQMTQQQQAPARLACKRKTKNRTPCVCEGKGGGFVPRGLCSRANICVERSKRAAVLQKGGVKRRGFDGERRGRHLAWQCPPSQVRVCENGSSFWLRKVVRAPLKRCFLQQGRSPAFEAQNKKIVLVLNEGGSKKTCTCFGLCFAWACLVAVWRQRCIK